MKLTKGVAVALSFETQVLKWAILSCAAASLLLLCGCTGNSSKNHAALAPSPPAFDPFAIEEPVDMARIRPASGFAGAGYGAMVDQTTYAALRANKPEPRDCSVRQRFDKSYLIAYQWGRTGENKLGLNIDGVGFDSMKVEAVTLEYTLRLQPWKTKKERCLYDSNWQGMIGSGYNELYVREGQNIWKEFRDFQDDVGSRLDTLMGN
jgi:hypothetical protein